MSKLMKVWMVLVVVGLTGCQNDAGLNDVATLINSINNLKELILGLANAFGSC